MIKILPPQKRLRITVLGKVQGVFFRAWSRDQARQRGLKGWVRNLPGGGVEITAEGPKDSLEEFISLCWKGPPAAQVENVRYHWEEAQEELREFEIRYF